MGAKIYLILILGLFGFLFILNKKKPKEYLFWSSMCLLFIRPLNIPGLGEINLPFLLLMIVFVSDLSNALTIKNFKGWRLYLFMLFVGFVTMLLNANELEGLSPNEIIQRSLLWIQNFAVVFIIGILISAFVKTKADLIKLEKIFLWNCFLFSITAIMAFLGFYDGVIIFGPGSFTGNTIQDYSRDIIFSEIYGISYSNLVFGVTTLSIVFLPTLKWSYLKKNIYLALIIFAVIISLKRLAIVSLIVVLLYYLIREKQKGRNTWLLVIPFLIFILGTTYYDLILKRFDGVLSSIDGTGVRDSSSDIRLDRIYLAIDAFAEQPLIGKGAGFLGYVHNGLFEVLGNLGLLGLLLFRPFFKLIFKKKFSFFFHNPWAISVFVFMFTLLLFESAVNRIEIMYFLGLLSGGAIAYNRLFSEHESKFTL